MDIAFQNPVYLFFLPAVLLLVFWSYYITTYVTPWKATCFAITGGCLVLASSAPSTTIHDSGTHQIVLVDVSDSIISNTDELTQKILNRSAPLNEEDKLSILLFAQDSRWILKRGTKTQRNRSIEQLEQIRGEITSSKTRPADAFQNALTTVRNNEKTSILLLSDGQFTFQQRNELITLAKNLDLPVSTRLLRRNTLRDLWIQSVSSPNFVRSGESFEVKISLNASANYEGQIRISKKQNSDPIQSIPISIQAGQKRTVRTTLKASQNAFQRYHVTVTSNGSEWTRKNNSFDFGVQRSDAVHILWTGNKSLYKQIKPSLAKKQLQFTYRSTPDRTDPYNLFIIAGPSSSTTDQWNSNVSSAVRNRGSGLIMLGSQNSFGLGDWRDTSIEQLLPVHVFPPDTFTLSILLDASGSMSHPPDRASTNPSSKLSVARNALTRSLTLMKPNDRLELIAFAQTPNQLRTLKPIGDVSSVAPLLNRLTASGETRLLPPLKQSLKTLSDSNGKNRFIFIYTDGQLNEKKTDFKRLADRARENRIRLIIFTTGDQADQSLLQTLTSNGKNGRVISLDSVKNFEKALKNELQRIRQFIHRELAGTKSPPENTNSFLSTDTKHIPRRTGPYHRVTEKSYALVQLRSETSDVLVAGWQPARGRSVAITPLYDHISELNKREQTAWVKVLQQSIQWTQPPQSSNWTLRSELTSEQLIIHLNHVGEKQQYSSLTATGTLQTSDGWKRSNIPSVPVSRTHLRFRTARPPAGTYQFQANIQYNDQAIQMGMPVNVPVEREYLYPSANESYLTNISDRTGGIPDATPSEIKELLQTQSPNEAQNTPLAKYLLMVAAAGLLLTLLRN